MKLRHHSHKKWKDSLETRAERAALCAYVKNYVVLEPTLLTDLLFRASKHKQTKTPGIKTVSELPIFKVFSFHCQDTNMPG